MLLTSNKVSVRSFNEGDITNKICWINNAENNEFLHYDIPLTYEKTLHWYHNKDNESRIDCVIEFDGVPVGLIGLLNISTVHRKAEFYICIGDTAVKRKGIATISTELILKYAFEEISLNKVFLNVDSKNVAACRLYEKIGFVSEGEFREDLFHRGKMIDRKRYAMLSKEFTVHSI